MTARMLPAGDDPILPATPTPLTITVDGVPATGVTGQTLAGVMLASGNLAWRRTSAKDRPRGVFCGIGICFDCVVEVNGQRDVRACLRRATEGDVLVSQHDILPGPAVFVERTGNFVAAGDADTTDSDPDGGGDNA